MTKLDEYLFEHEEQTLTFLEGRVLLDKNLRMILNRLGYRLQLEDYATKLILFFGDQCLGTIEYTLKEEWHDKGKKGYYEQMYLDLSTFPFLRKDKC